MNDTVLEFDNVSMQDPLDKGGALQHADFRVGRSDFLLLVADAAKLFGQFTDIALGLIMPNAGEVRIHGRGWSQMRPSKAEGYRGRTGHVFPEGHGWVSNLTIEENITLSARHHTSLPDHDIRDRMYNKMNELGCPRQTLEMRPEEARWQDLQAADWIRAFIADRDLFIFEGPIVGFTPEQWGCLKRWINEARARGAAVISIVDDSAGWLDIARLIVRYLNKDGIISMEER